MSFPIRICTYIILILLATSIYHDLSGGTSIGDIQPAVNHTEENTRKINVVKIKVHPGDTVLSISEELNNMKQTINIQQIYEDFQAVNHTNPNQLIAGKTYYFPLYKQDP